MGSEPGSRSGGLDRSGEIGAVSDGVHDAMRVTGSRVAFLYDRVASTDCSIALGIPVGLDEGEAW